MITEFRVSDDGSLFAFYDPGNAPWFAPKPPLEEEWKPNPDFEGWNIPNPWMKGRFVDSGKIDGFGFEWIRFLPVSVASREVLDVVKTWAMEQGMEEAVVKNLLARLERKGFSLPDENDE